MANHASVTTEPSTQPSEPIITSAPPSTPPETQARLRRPAIVQRHRSPSWCYLSWWSWSFTVNLHHDHHPRCRGSSSPPHPIRLYRSVAVKICQIHVMQACTAAEAHVCPSHRRPAKTEIRVAASFALAQLRWSAERTCHAPPACTNAIRQLVREVAKYQSASVWAAAGVRYLIVCLVVMANAFSLGIISTPRSANFPASRSCSPNLGHLLSRKTNTSSDVRWPNNSARQYYESGLKKRSEIFHNAGYILVSPPAGKGSLARSQMVQDLLLTTLAEAGYSSSETKKRIIPLTWSRDIRISSKFYQNLNLGSTVWWNDRMEKPYDSFLRREDEAYGDAMNDAVIVTVIPQECVTRP